MKKFLLLVCLLLSLIIAQADDFKVLFVNDNNLKYVNGKVVKVGDTFTDVNDIDWKKEKQAVKAINMTTRKQTLFVGKNWIKRSGIDAIFHNRHLSTHDGQDDNAELTIYDKLQKMFADQYDLLDSIVIPSEVKLSGACYFQATYEYGDTRLTKKLGHHGQSVIIDKTLFHVDDEHLEPRDVFLSIDYNDDASGLTIFVKDNIELNVYPETLE